MKIKTNISFVLFVLLISCVCLVFCGCGKKRKSNEMKIKNVITTNKTILSSAKVNTISQKTNNYFDDNNYYKNVNNDVNKFWDAFALIDNITNKDFKNVAFALTPDEFVELRINAYPLIRKKDYKNCELLMRFLMCCTNKSQAEKVNVEYLLADSLWKQGKYTNAIPYYKKVFDYGEKLAKNKKCDDSDTLIASQKLSSFLFKNGEINDSLKCSEQALKIIENAALPPDATESYRCSHILNLINCGKINEAEKATEKYVFKDKGYYNAIMEKLRKNN